MRNALCKLYVGCMFTLVSISSSWAESICENQVPVTNNNPAAITTSGNYSSSYPGIQAFDGNRSTMWISKTYQNPAWIAYQFNTAKKVDRYSIDFTNGSLTSRAPKNFELQAYSNGSWKTLDRRTNQINWGGSEKRSYLVSQSGYYTQYRLVIEEDNDDRAPIVVVSMGELLLETCGCQQSNELVPILTSNSSAVETSGIYDSSYPAWKAFDSSVNSMWISAVWQTPAWIGYSWGTPRYVDSYAITYANGSIRTRAPKVWELKGWNGSSWVTVDSRSNETNWGGFETRHYTVQTPGSYSKYRLQFNDDNDARAGVVVISLGNLSFKGCQIDSPQVVEANLYGQWHEDQNQSTADTEYYVPTSIDLGASRFRNHISLFQGGNGEFLRLAPNDAHYFVPTTWVLSGNKLTVTFTDSRWASTAGTFDYVYEIISAGNGVLHLKVISKTKR